MATRSFWGRPMQTDMDPTGAYLVYAVGIPLVLLLIVFEATLCALRGWRYYTRSDTLGSLGLLICTSISIVLSICTRCCRSGRSGC